MFVTLAQIKMNNDYSFYSSSAPTVNNDSSAGFAAGDTWLDTTTGYSYSASGVLVGAAVWEQIEQGQDNLITLSGDNIFLRMLKNLGNDFVVPRNVPFEDLTNSDFPTNTSFRRDKAADLVFTEACYSQWTFDSAGKTITSGDDLYGDLDSFLTGDYILISGSRRNDGYYTVASVTSSVITVNESIADGEAYAFIRLVSFPDDFMSIMGRLIWYDIFVAPKQSTGLKSERIGTYNYTLQDLSAMGYPADIIRGLQAYQKISVGGSSYFVN